ncbi:MAG: RNA polymerase sigma factor, partial [Phycisphaerae bacterium]|nr:RNA polymerase sigma factor [Phycisphaerae bacterium]
RAPRSGLDIAILDRPAHVHPTPAALTSRGTLPPDQRSFDDDVLHALDGLEETARACLLLRTVVDLPYKEIARALDVPEGTAMSHVHRARRVLREKLDERHPVSTRTGPS